jgi:hypothetical protein
MKISQTSTLVIMDKEELKETFREIITDLVPSIEMSKRQEKSVGEHIPQSEAMRILNRKTTWFYLKRKSGELPAKKSGNQWWYLKEDIEAFVKNGEVSS